jgi:hypothetical protein
VLMVESSWLTAGGARHAGRLEALRCAADGARSTGATRVPCGEGCAAASETLSSARPTAACPHLTEPCCNVPRAAQRIQESVLDISALLHGQILVLHEAGGTSYFLHVSQDESLLPAVHVRVGLALRLDAFERTEAKRHADKSWMRAAAEDLGESPTLQRSCAHPAKLLHVAVEAFSAASLQVALACSAPAILHFALAAMAI